MPSDLCEALRRALGAEDGRRAPFRDDDDDGPAIFDACESDRVNVAAVVVLNVGAV